MSKMSKMERQETMHVCSSMPITKKDLRHKVTISHLWLKLRLCKRRK